MEFNRRAFTQTLAAFGLVAAGQAAAQGKKTVEVAMQGDSAMPIFFPKSVNISAGDTVRWTNKNILVHTVTLDPKQATKPSDIGRPAGVKPFGSKDLNQDDTYSHTFTVKGIYKYVCKYHEAMGTIGTVVVS